MGRLHRCGANESRPRRINSGVERGHHKARRMDSGFPPARASKKVNSTPAYPWHTLPPFHLTTLFLRQTILDWANCGILFERVACRVFIHVVHPCARARPRTINDQKMAGRTDRGDKPSPADRAWTLPRLRQTTCRHRAFDPGADLLQDHAEQREQARRRARGRSAVRIRCPHDQERC